MAVPMTAAQFAAVLRTEGLTVVEYDGWETHNRNHVGAWGPVHGVMIHHTVTSGSARTVEICRTGHAGLPGPLCHGVITKDGRVHLVGYGRANHAGSGDGDVLAAVIAESALPADNEANTDGNRHFYGFECENLGDGRDPWPEAQLRAIERVSAAVCRHHGWAAASVIGHLEWQPGKVDPRGFTMASMRARVAARLGNNPPEEDGMPTIDEIVNAMATKDGHFGVSARWRESNPTNDKWKLESILAYIGDRALDNQAALKAIATKFDTPAPVTLTDAQVEALAARVAAAPGLADAIAGKVAALLAERLAE